MLNPYIHHGPNLENSATKVLVITPDDDADLSQVCKALRIYNPNDVAATIHLLTTGGSEVTLTIPSKTLWTEPTVVEKVFETGTTVELIIHGYTD